jgi:cysteine desulfurase
MKPIYLDYAATTPVDPRVAEKMMACLTPAGMFGNPASKHTYGEQARSAVETAREQVASAINADPAEIIWTSGATESDNLAIKGAVALLQRKGRHVVTMKTEHKAVLDTCQHLEKEGYQVTYLTPETDGRLNQQQFEAALRSDTVLVSIMHVNNETGVIQDIDAIARITSSRGILLHVDAAQSIGKVMLDVSKTPIDLVSLSAHKVYGPKGIGALYLRKKPRVRVAPLIHGGGHEQGMRSGTLAPHQIVGMGEAFALAQQNWQQETQRIRQLRNQFVKALQTIAVFRLNTNLDDVVPHIVSVRFEGMLADALLAQWPILAASTASACQGSGTEGSYVLRAMGYSTEQIKSAIRFSFGRFTTSEEIDAVIQQISSKF